jgi:hypothetical protein
MEFLCGLHLEAEGFTVFGNLGNSTGQGGNSLSGARLGVSLQLQPFDDSSFAVSPFFKGGGAYVAGGSSARRYSIPDDQRGVGIMGAGLELSGNFTETIGAFSGAEMLFLPGLGFSASLGLKVNIDSVGTVKLAFMWMYVPNTGVSSGIRPGKTLDNLGTNGGGLVLGGSF